MSKTRQPVIRSFSARFAPGCRIGWHSHAWNQLVYASEGVITVDAEQSSWLVPVRRGVWISAGTRHQIGMHGSVFLQSIYLRARAHGLPGSGCAVVSLSPLMHELICHVTGLGVIYDDTAENRNLIRFLKFQLQTLTSMPLHVRLPCDARARRLARRILADPGVDQSLQELSRDCETSLRTMQRVFRQEVGMPLARWRNQVRMLHAMRLLAGGASVTRTSLESGFDSLSAFIQSFRRHFGETPGRYMTRTRRMTSAR